MFDEFQQEVLKAYRDLRDRHALPDGLVNLTRSNLRRRALWLIANNDNRQDEDVIKQFFDPNNRYADNEERIKRFELDKFRPLILFLKGEIERTDEKNIKILAWLIDFEPRPYQEWCRVRATAITAPIPTEGIDSGGNTPPPIGTPPRPVVLPPLPPSPPMPQPPSRKKPILYGLIALALIYGGYQLYNWFDRECMFWENDRYVVVACDKTIPGAILLPADKKKLNEFRKITRPDTLTEKDLGKVWYTGIKRDSVEFYTAPGSYPLDLNKKLRPVTEYILNKYVLEK